MTYDYEFLLSDNVMSLSVMPQGNKRPNAVLTSAQKQQSK